MDFIGTSVLFIHYCRFGTARECSRRFVCLWKPKALHFFAEAISHYSFAIGRAATALPRPRNQSPGSRTEVDKTQASKGWSN